MLNCHYDLNNNRRDWTKNFKSIMSLGKFLDTFSFINSVPFRHMACRQSSTIKKLFREFRMLLFVMKIISE